MRHDEFLNTRPTEHEKSQVFSKIRRLFCRTPETIVAPAPPIDARRTTCLSVQAQRLVATDLLFQTERRPSKHIVTAATHVYSQNFEDAIIAEIFSRIEERSRTFVEIGVESGTECNTRLLLERGWEGLWIEGNSRNADAARRRMSGFIDNGKLSVIEAMVTPENIDSCIQSKIGKQEIDFLSIDIDYNTSHIWRACSTSARVCCIEYNASLPPQVVWEVPYDPTKMWDGSNRFGASLKTLELIGRDKGLNLVGCDFHGVNAFFVDNRDCGDKFLQPYAAEVHFTPPRFHLGAHRGHHAD